LGLQIKSINVWSHLEENHFLAKTYNTVSIFITNLDAVALLVLVLKDSFKF